MPEKVMQAQTLGPNVNTCTGQPLAFAHSSGTVQKCTSCPFCHPSSLLSLIVFCFCLRPFGSCHSLRFKNVELWDAVDENRLFFFFFFFCVDCVSNRYGRDRLEEWCDSYVIMTFLRHFLSLKYYNVLKCYLVDVFACTAEVFSSTDLFLV